MIRKHKYATLFILCLFICFLLSGCELFYKQVEPGKMYLINIGISYGTGNNNTKDNSTSYRRIYRDANGLITIEETSDTVGILKSNFADSSNVAACFKALCKMEGREISISSFLDFDEAEQRDHNLASFPSKENIIAEIRGISSNASKNDTLVFYCSSHGYSVDFNNTGSRPSIDYSYSNSYTGQGGIATITYLLDSYCVEYCSAEEILTAMKDFPGNKSLILDLCHSGTFITENNVSTDSTTYSTSKNNIDVFSDLLFDDSAVVQSSGLYVLAASKMYESSFTDGDLSLFTRHMLSSLGWDYKNQTIKNTIPACSFGLITLQNLADKTQEDLNTSSNQYKTSQHMKITGGSMDLVLFDFN